MKQTIFRIAALFIILAFILLAVPMTTGQAGTEYQTIPTAIPVVYITPLTPTPIGAPTATPVPVGNAVYIPAWSASRITIVLPNNPSIHLVIDLPATSENRYIRVQDVTEPMPQVDGTLFEVFGQPFTIVITDVNGNEITAFNPPLTFTIQYGAEDISEAEEPNLKLYTLVNGVWTLVNAQVDTLNNHLLASVDHLTTFVIFCVHASEYQTVPPIISQTPQPTPTVASSVIIEPQQPQSQPQIAETPIVPTPTRSVALPGILPSALIFGGIAMLVLVILGVSVVMILRATVGK